MKTPFTFSGQFWIPGSTVVVSGVLTYEPSQQPNLQLNGTLGDQETFHIDQESFHIIILGRCSNGKLVTLYKCLMTNQHTSFPGYTVETYLCAICLIGHHYTNESEILFNSISLEIEGLNDWLNPRFYLKPVDIKRKTYHIYDIKTKIPLYKTIKLKDHNMTINYNYSITYGDNLYPIRNITSCFYLEFIEQKKLIDLWDYIQKLCNLVSLGMGQSCMLTNLIGKANYLKKNEYVEFYSYSYGIDKIKNYNRIFRPFSYNDVSKNFGIYYKSWIKTSNKFGPTCESLFACFDNPYVNAIHEFISLTQALESYHGRKYDNDQVIPIKNYNNIINNLNEIVNNEDISKESKDFMLNKINYWNSKTLRMRLKELFINYKILTNVVNEKNFIDKIVNTRNYYTHYDKELENKIIPSKDLPLYNQTLKYLVIVLLLMESKFEEEKIKKIVENYKHLGIERIY